MLPGALLPWYDENKRQLPWREDREPYHIWISEIMLQQTRVEAVKGYYRRFLEELPTVADLASCPYDRLHKLWEGLGYYSRVRNLKKAAVEIVEHRNGHFPEEYSDILKLPGIGPYTAGAIASIAFDCPTPAVDGNVLRVIARLTDDDTAVDQPAFKQRVQRELGKIYPSRAGDFTQALMELGATVCGPNRAPQCDACPCRTFCLGNRSGRAAQLPIRSPKKEKKIEERTVFILSCQGRWALERRPDKGLLAGLWQYPNTDGKLDAAQALEAVGEMGLRPVQIFKQLERSHIFTHIRWEMRGIYLEVKEPAGKFTWMSNEEIDRIAALPTAFRQFREEGEYV